MDGNVNSKLDWACQWRTVALVKIYMFQQKSRALEGKHWASQHLSEWISFTLKLPRLEWKICDPLPSPVSPKERIDPDSLFGGIIDETHIWAINHGNFYLGFPSWHILLFSSGSWPKKIFLENGWRMYSEIDIHSFEQKKLFCDYGSWIVKIHIQSTLEVTYQEENWIFSFESVHFGCFREFLMCLW